MAKMPEHAKLIPNPKTFAAGFYVENVFVLPGVPSILQAMIPYLDAIVKSGKKIISISIDSGLRESAIADGLSVIQKNFPDVDIGSYPYFQNHSGTVLVLRSIFLDKIKDCEKEVKNLILNLKNEN
jgi:molybdopterin-biosynthesis enzyme MoeA-like protein